MAADSSRKADANGTEAAEGVGETATNVPGQVAPLAETTNQELTAEKGADGTAAVDPKTAKPRVPRERKQRGPPEDGVASKTKVMVANLPYDLREDKVISGVN